MSHWKILLSDGDWAEEGVGTWVEIPGQSLPWRRLCEYLEENDLWIDTLYIDTPNGKINISSFKERDGSLPEFYAIQNDLVVDNVLGDANVTNILHVSCHFNNGTILHAFFNEEGLVDFNVSNEEYKPLVPSPRRKVEAK